MTIKGSYPTDCPGCTGTVPLHSPLPWRVDLMGDIVDSTGLFVAEAASEPTAQSIVTAVNAHADLLAALKSVTEHLENQRDYMLNNGSAEE